MLYSINYAILTSGQLRTSQNQLLFSNLDEIHLIGLFPGLLICLCEQNCRKLSKNTYFGRFVKFHIKRMSISEEICTLTVTHLPMFPMKPLYMYCIFFKADIYEHVLK